MEASDPGDVILPENERDELITKLRSSLLLKNQVEAEGVETVAIQARGVNEGTIGVDAGEIGCVNEEVMEVDMDETTSATEDETSGYLGEIEADADETTSVTKDVAIVRLEEIEAVGEKEPSNKVKFILKEDKNRLVSDLTKAVKETTSATEDKTSVLYLGEIEADPDQTTSVAEDLAIVRLEEIEAVEEKEPSNKVKFISKEDKNRLVSDLTIEVKETTSATEDEISVYQEVIEADPDQTTSVTEDVAIVSLEEIESVGEKEPRRILNKARFKLTEDVDRFVSDLITAVKEIRSEFKRDIPKYKYTDKDIQSPHALHFSQAHRHTIWKYLSSQRQRLDSFINKYTGKALNAHVFDDCKERCIKIYKPQKYSEVGFVNFCAAIAYLGILCLEEKLDRNATIKAKGYIGLKLSDVLERGTIHESSW